MNPEAELIEILKNGRVTHPRAVHDYGCPAAKRTGFPKDCRCGAWELDQKIVSILKRLGLACHACGAYKARNGQGHYAHCRHSHIHTETKRLHEAI